jgi:hypothetical protein
MACARGIITKSSISLKPSKMRKIDFLVFLSAPKIISMLDMKLNIPGVITKPNPTVYILLGLILLFITLIAVPRIGQAFFQFDDFALLPTFSSMSLSEHFSHAPFEQYRPFTHWFLGVQFQLFSWQHPGMFTLMSLGLHMCNVILFFLLLQLAQIRSSIALFAASCFLFAPCTNETYLWLTCQFDLLCVFWELLSCLTLIAFDKFTPVFSSERRSIWTVASEMLYFSILSS